MIKKLSSIKIKGFRGIKGSDQDVVQLDGDIVLVYGENACGKSSLMQAIELGITGNVEEFADGGNDYPRCLRYAFEDLESQVQVSYKDEYEKINTSSVNIKKTISFDTNLEADGQKFFKERCYLPQKKLNRLLDEYRSTGKGEDNPPLMRFILEMLNLNKIDNITEGLKTFKDKRRVEKKCTNIAEVNEELSSLNEMLDRTKTNGQSLERQVEASIIEAKDLLKRFPNYDLPETWELISLEEWKKDFDEQFMQTNKRRMLNLQRVEGELHQMFGTIESVVAETKDINSQSLEEELKMLQKKLDEEEENLGKRISKLLLPIDNEIESSRAKTEYDSLASSYKMTIELIVSRSGQIRRKINRDNEINKDLAEKRKELVHISGLLDEIKALSGNDVGNHKDRIEFLNHALTLIVDESCPVCERDYNECSDIGLVERVKETIETLGGSISELEASLKKRSELLARKEQVLFSIEEINNKEFWNESQIKENEELIIKLLNVKEQLLELGTEVDQVDQLKSKVTELGVTSQLVDKNQILLKNTKERMLKAVELISIDINLEKPDYKNDILNKMASKMNEYKKQGDEARQVIDSISKTLELVKNQKDNQERCKKYELRIGALDRLKEEIDNEIGMVRKFDASVSRVRSKIIEKVFSDGLNSLWSELFNRLAKREPFRPEIAPPKLFRGKLRSSVMAVYDGVEPFEDITNILSSGNINTAALSLFLTLNLIEPPLHNVILLDDPVQNMDDVHVTQLASLLRAIRDNGRQVVLSVHDKALFEYLKIELGPTREGETLVTVKLNKDTSGQNTIISSEKHEWFEDKVKFGKIVS